ncbi:MAG: EamA family transporter [Steroidobacteraceae bacterium]|jgi:drug/metabolite transporter (DMT)-like permease
MRRAEQGVAAAIAAVVIWGLVPVGTRFFVLKFDALTFNVIRFAFSGAAALPLLLMGKPWAWPSADRRRLLFCALLAVSGYNIPVAFAARSISAGHLGLLIATEPVFIVLFAAWLQKRRVHWRVIVGGAVAFVGVGLTSLAAGMPRLADWAGPLLVLLGAMSWSLYTVLVASLTRRHGALPVTGGVLVIGAIVLIAASLPMIHSDVLASPLAVGEIGAMGLVSSLLGFVLWNHAASAVPSERLGLFLYLLPLVSISAGAWMLDEHITALLVCGGALTLAGVAFGERSKPQSPASISALPSDLPG